jgi:hypothetical protein
MGRGEHGKDHHGDYKRFVDPRAIGSPGGIAARIYSKPRAAGQQHIVPERK